jgi:hypothetical protein
VAECDARSQRHELSEYFHKRERWDAALQTSSSSTSRCARQRRASSASIPPGNDDDDDDGEADDSIGVSSGAVHTTPTTSTDNVTPAHTHPSSHALIAVQLRARNLLISRSTQKYHQIKIAQKKVFIPNNFVLRIDEITASIKRILLMCLTCNSMNGKKSIIHNIT